MKVTAYPEVKRPEYQQGVLDAKFGHLAGQARRDAEWDFFAEKFLLLEDLNEIGQKRPFTENEKTEFEEAMALFFGSDAPPDQYKDGRKTEAAQRQFFVEKAEADAKKEPPKPPDNIRDFETALKNKLGFSARTAKRIAAEGFKNNG